jgi:uncharacterized membrane protein YkgB
VNWLNDKVALGLIAFSCLLMAISTLLIGDDPSLTRVVSFYNVNSLVNGQVVSLVASAVFFIVSALAVLTIKQAHLGRYLGYGLVVTSGVVLVTLLDSQRYIAALGGFPAIGSGQGIIKYFALLAIAIHLLAKNHLSSLQQQLIQLFPVVLVLAWIGGMKFTEIEAHGIEALVSSSPLMRWMYQLWSVQTVSNLIGVYDLLAVCSLLLSLRVRAFFWPGMVMAAGVMLTTQSFLVSWPDALSATTLLTSGGQFLIKDLWFIANLVLICQIRFGDNAKR